MYLLLLCKTNPESQFLITKYVIHLNTTKIKSSRSQRDQWALSSRRGHVGESCAGLQGDGGHPPSPLSASRLRKAYFHLFPCLSRTSPRQCCAGSCLPAFCRAGEGWVMSYTSPWPSPGRPGGTDIPTRPRPSCPPGTRHLPERRAADNEQAIKRLSKRRHRVNAIRCSSSIFINSYIGFSESRSRMKVIAILTQTLKWLICL